MEKLSLERLGCTFLVTDHLDRNPAQVVETYRSLSEIEGTFLTRKVAYQTGVELSLHALLKELTSVREVALIHPQGTPARREDHIALGRISPRQRRPAEALENATSQQGSYTAILVSGLISAH